jgi:Na+-transporting methylmalonyl-CoA/oxaloacetate decarboxylase gamma subunit
MPLIIEAILMSMGMIVIFFLAFLVLFILALALAPIERELSKYIWTHTAPPPLKVPTPTGSFRDFSKKF